MRRRRRPVPLQRLTGLGFPRSITFNSICARSSDGQSVGLRLQRPEVRILPGTPKKGTPRRTFFDGDRNTGGFENPLRSPTIYPKHYAVRKRTAQRLKIPRIVHAMKHIDELITDAVACKSEKRIYRSLKNC